MGGGGDHIYIYTSYHHLYHIIIPLYSPKHPGISFESDFLYNPGDGIGTVNPATGRGLDSQGSISLGLMMIILLEEIRQAPVEVGSLSHYLPGFLAIMAEL